MHINGRFRHTTKGRGGVEGRGVICVRHSQTPGGARQWRTLLPPPTPFSRRAGPLSVVVGQFSETPYQTRDTTEQPRLMRLSEARLRLACPPSGPPNGVAHRRGCWWCERPPPFLALVRHGRGLGGARTDAPPTLPFWGGRSHHSDPCGKAEVKTWSQVILVNLALAAVGLRAWLDPWPARGEVPLLDLVAATDPWCAERAAGETTPQAARLRL